jgi:RND family efflux transporter MFP subunit
MSTESDPGTDVDTGRTARKARWVLLALFVVFVGAVALRIATRGSVEPPPTIEEVRAARGAPVDVAMVAPQDLEVWLLTSARVRGANQVTVTSRIPSKVGILRCRPGQEVRKGDVLVRLDRDSPAMGYQQYDQARSVYENARREHERLSNLFAEGAVSQQALDAARTALEIAEANWRAASSAADLVSPVDGIVTRVEVDEGDDLGPGTPVAVVSSLDTMRLRADVTDTFVRSVDVGSPARVAVEASVVSSDAPSYLTGSVSWISLAADPETRLFEIEAVLPNRGKALLPESVTDLEVLAARREGALTVSAEAILDDDEGTFVFTVSADSTAQRTPVTAGIRTDSQVEIMHGLAIGDRVVIRGQRSLEPGAKVWIHRTPAGSGEGVP